MLLITGTVAHIDRAVCSEASEYTMDIEMPEMDGYEATLRIRKLPNRIRANIPIVAFTANAVPENRDRAFAVGMDGFLVKPVNTSRLLSSLAKLL